MWFKCRWGPLLHLSLCHLQSSLQGWIQPVWPVGAAKNIRGDTMLQTTLVFLWVCTFVVFSCLIFLTISLCAKAYRRNTITICQDTHIKALKMQKFALLMWFPPSPQQSLGYTMFHEHEHENEAGEVEGFQFWSRQQCNSEGRNKCCCMQTVSVWCIYMDPILHEVGCGQTWLEIVLNTWL